MKPIVAKLIVRLSPASVDLLQWIINKAFQINGGLAFQMTINAFKIDFLIGHIQLIFDAFNNAQSENIEVAAYYLKIIEHILTTSKVTETEILRWLSNYGIINKVQNAYFSNMKRNLVTEPVKGAILDFLTTL